MPTQRVIPKELAHLIQHNLHTIEGLQSKLDQSTYVYVGDDRTCFGIPLLRHSHTLAYSISFLLRHELLAPAFTLFRPMFEGFARAIWALCAATDEDLREARKDKFPTLYAVIEAISDSELSGAEWFTRTYELNKSSLHSLTHGGIEMILLLYNDSPEKVEPDYPVGEQIQLMRVVQDITLATEEVLKEFLHIKGTSQNLT